MDDLRKRNSYLPWNCVICAIDPGKVSGIAYKVPGRTEVITHTVSCKNKHMIEYYCNAAKGAALVNRIPIIYIIEENRYYSDRYKKGSGHWGRKQHNSMVENIGVWKHFIEPDKKVGRWKPKILMLPRDEWRRGIYGRAQKPAHAPPDYWKRAAMHHPIVIREKIEDHNAAEARLMVEFGSKWWKVGEQAGVKPIEGKE